MRFFAHAEPTHAVDAGRALTDAEESALRDAVDAHGTRDWDAVSAATGLAWPRWRLLQAWRRLEARSVSTERWDTARDGELLAATKRLMVDPPAGRKVSWLVSTSFAAPFI